MCPLGGLLKAFTHRVAEFDGKNYPKACLRGVFSSKIRIALCAKAFKRVLYVFFLKLSQHYYNSFANTDRTKLGNCIGSLSVSCARHLSYSSMYRG